MNMLLASIIVYMLGMLLIGYYAYKRTSNLTDYMLGGRSLGPTVTALSAGASDMSGWLMMGLPGAMFASGLSASWIAIGLTLGAYANWLYVAPRLRTYTEVANNSITIPAYLENRFGDSSRMLRLVSALVIMVFLRFTSRPVSFLAASCLKIRSTWTTTLVCGLSASLPSRTRCLAASSP